MQFSWNLIHERATPSSYLTLPASTSLSSFSAVLNESCAYSGCMSHDYNCYNCYVESTQAVLLSFRHSSCNHYPIVYQFSSREEKGGLS